MTDAPDIVPRQQGEPRSEPFEGGSDEPVVGAPRRVSSEGAGGVTFEFDRLRLAPTLALVVVVVLVTSGLAYLLAAIRQPVYGAEAQVLYRSADTSGLRSERELSTQQVLVQGRSVLQPVADGYEVSVADLQEWLSVDIIGESEVLRVRVAHPDQSVALELTQAVAEQYVDTVRQETRRALDAATQPLTERLDDLLEELADVEARIRRAQQDADPAAEPTARQQRLEAEADALRRRIATVEDQLARTELEQPAQPQVRILAPAYALEDPVSTSPEQAAVGGVLVGLLLAGGAITAMAARRPSRR